VVCGADESFAMPLAVVLASTVANLDANRRISVFVLDGGLTRASAERITSLGTPDRVSVHVLRPDLSVLEKLPISSHVNVCTYLRLLIPRVLPESLERAIYLDSDMVVLSDLGRLWDEPLDGRHCLAVQDLSAPVMDARHGLPAYRRCAPYLSTIRPIPNYKAFGFPPFKKYFNVGVMAIDLAKWRQDDVTARLLQCLNDNRRHLRWHDQYALNVVLADGWRELDYRWNQTSHVYAFPSWERSPLSAETFDLVRSDPFIVHFNTRRKPWHVGCQHPKRAAFFQYLAMTPWAGARATRRPWNLKRWCRERVEDTMVLGGRSYRWLTARAASAGTDVL